MFITCEFIREVTALTYDIVSSVLYPGEIVTGDHQQIQTAVSLFRRKRSIADCWPINLKLSKQNNHMTL